MKSVTKHFQKKPKEESSKTTGEKPCFCEIRNKSFFERGNLKKLFQTYTGDKPHICDVCNKGFLQVCNPKQHLQKKMHMKSLMFVKL